METIWSTKDQTINGIHSIIFKVSVLIHPGMKDKIDSNFFPRYLRIWYRLKKAKRRAHMDFLNPVPLQQIYGRMEKKIEDAVRIDFVFKAHLLVDWVVELSVEVFEENSVGINSYLVSTNFKSSKPILFVY